MREPHDEQLSQAWQLFTFDPVTLPPRYGPVFCPLNETEILIAGGRNVNGFRNDVRIFNTEDRSVMTLVQGSDEDLKFFCYGN